MMPRLTLSASMFTAIPVRAQAEPGPAEAAGALLGLPAIGAVIGAAAALPAAAIRAWTPHADLLGAVLAVAALIALTRGLHLDGLADTADGLGSRASAERALEIMKQSDIGPFGVVTLILILAADIGSLAGLPGGAWAPVGALAVGAATGRVAAVHAAASPVPAARESGFGALVAGRVSVAAAAAWTVVVLGFGAAVAVALSVPPGWVVGPQAAALIVAWRLRRHATRRIGGISGDVFGALIETATAVTLIGPALR
jgi:adenosylcobinamide-GDP ribazoletransferase